MGRAEIWQGLFREKGWWDGNRITAPKGYRLAITIYEKEHTLYGEGTKHMNNDNSFLLADMTFISQQTDSDSYNPYFVPGCTRYENFYLWDDIMSARLFPGEKP